MIVKMALISALILAILFATWIKDKEKMDPPLKRRIGIDLTVIGSLWLLFLVFELTSDPTTEMIVAEVVNIGLLYFVGQFVYLIASISPVFGGLIDLLKRRGYSLTKEDDKKGEE